MSKKSQVKSAKRKVKVMNKARAEVASAKREVKTATAIQRAPQEAPTPGGVQSVLRGSLGLLSQLIPNLTPPELATLDTQLRPIAKAFEACHKLAKDRLLAVVKETGAPFNENGSLETQLPGFRVQAWRTAPKLDPVKVWALTNGKGIPPANVGNPLPVEVQYDLDMQKLERLVTEGVISKEELDSCKTNERWVLQEPKPVTEVSE